RLVGRQNDLPRRGDGWDDLQRPVRGWPDRPTHSSQGPTLPLPDDRGVLRLGKRPRRAPQFGWRSGVSGRSGPAARASREAHGAIRGLAAGRLSETDGPGTLAPARSSAPSEGTFMRTRLLIIWPPAPVAQGIERRFPKP